MILHSDFRVTVIQHMQCNQDTLRFFGKVYILQKNPNAELFVFRFLPLLFKKEKRKHVLHLIAHFRDTAIQVLRIRFWSNEHKTNRQWME